jgi:hypothetical protein
MQNSSKIFFSAFFTSFDRARAADHEKQLFTLPKYVIQVKNTKKSKDVMLFEKHICFKKCFMLRLVLVLGL